MTHPEPELYAEAERVVSNVYARGWQFSMDREGNPAESVDWWGFVRAVAAEGIRRGRER